jgi:murein tripeptide amidase MpaA
MLPVREHL